MARRTKKVGISGKYGQRYGIRVRKRLRATETSKSQRYPCPQCGKTAVKRRDTSIWACKHCGMVQAGDAFSPSSVNVYKKYDLEPEIHV